MLHQRGVESEASCARQPLISEEINRLTLQIFLLQFSANFFVKPRLKPDCARISIFYFAPNSLVFFRYAVVFYLVTIQVLYPSTNQNPIILDGWKIFGAIFSAMPLSVLLCATVNSSANRNKRKSVTYHTYRSSTVGRSLCLRARKGRASAPTFDARKNEWWKKKHPLVHIKAYQSSVIFWAYIRVIAGFKVLLVGRGFLSLERCLYHILRKISLFL